MIIYILLLLYLLFLSLLFVNKKFNKLVFIILSFTPFIIISGFRDFSVGVDTQQFVNAYARIINMSPRNFDLLRYEQGFSYFCWTLGKISSNPQILIFTTSFFINISIGRFIYKNSDNVYLSVILYLLCNFFFSYMNIMRQAIAICILLWGYEFIKNKKYFNFLLFVIIACSFHFSSLLALLYIPLRNFKFNKNFLFVSIGISMIGFLFGENLFMLLANLSPRLMNYLDSSFTEANYFAALLDFLVYFFVFAFGIILIKQSDRKLIGTKDNNMVIGIMGVATILSALSMKVILFDRFTPYFSIFLIIWLPNSLLKIYNAKNRMLFTVIIVSLFVVYCLIILILRPEWYGVSNYKFY